MIAADELDNARSLRETLGPRRTGRRGRLSTQAARSQHWYYRGLAAALLARDPDCMLFRTLDAEVRTVFPDPTRVPLVSSPASRSRPPHDARAYLAQPIKHWKPGYSAYELAHAWVARRRIAGRGRRASSATSTASASSSRD